MFAFGIGSGVAGAAGCFYASFVGTLVPDAFFITESFTILAMVIVGGMGTLIGPVFGAILLTVLPELLRGIGDLRLVVYGVTLTLVVLFMPGGMVQAARYVMARLKRLRPAASRSGRRMMARGGSTTAERNEAAWSYSARPACTRASAACARCATLPFRFRPARSLP